MNKLPLSKRVAVVSALVEGNSLRSTCRMTGVAMNTVLKLLADLGEACAQLHDERVRDVRAKRVQADEVWQFVYSKAKNVPEDKQDTFERQRSLNIAMRQSLTPPTCSGISHSK